VRHGLYGSGGSKALAILGINYSIVHFDDTGQIDAAKDEREMRLAMELLPPLFEEQQPAQIINAKERFIKKQYEHEFKWVPTPKLERAIIETISRTMPGSSTAASIPPTIHCFRHRSDRGRIDAHGLITATTQYGSSNFFRRPGINERPTIPTETH